MRMVTAFGVCLLALGSWVWQGRGIGGQEVEIPGVAAGPSGVRDGGLLAELAAARSQRSRAEERLVRLQVESLELNVRQLREALRDAEHAAATCRSDLARVSKPEKVSMDWSPPPLSALPRLARRKPATGREREGSGRSKDAPGVLESTARVQILGEEVWVSGRVKNKRREFLDGTLWIELLHDGSVINTHSYATEIGSGEGHEYSTQFYAFGYHGGTFSARARFEY